MFLQEKPTREWFSFLLYFSVLQKILDYSIFPNLADESITVSRITFRIKAYRRYKFYVPWLQVFSI